MVIAHDVTIRALSDRAVRGLEQQLRGTVVRPGDGEYDQARRVWNPAIDRYPALVVRPRCAADVFHAIDFARANDLPLAVRSGGHSLDGHGTVDNGLVVDLSNMKRLVIDPMRRMAWAEPGLTWGEYLDCAERYRLVTPSGDARSVGFGGLTLGGGIGWLVRKHGLTIDNLLAVDIVSADGRRLQASDNEHPDLFWALRGGGGNFGVATGFRFRLQPVSPILGGAIASAWVGDLERRPERHVAWTEASWQAVAPRTDGAYVNFIHAHDEGEERIRAAYPPATYARLSAIKRRYDPDNLFHLNANVRPG